MSDVIHEQFLEPIPAGRRQLPTGKLLRMSLRGLRHQSFSTLLQMGTVAATAAFLAFVGGEMVVTWAAAKLPTASSEAAGRMAQLLWILIISLLVCTISNITGMLLSVTRRFRDIGTMKCLGAFDRTILWLFLVEAFLLTGVGAAGGAILGTLASLASALFTHGGAIMSASVGLSLLAVTGSAIAVILLLGMLGAAYPAIQASRMLPIEAMRSIQ
jgi:cell division protein FtsX